MSIQIGKKFIFKKVRISEYTFSEYTFSGAKSEMAVTFLKIFFMLSQSEETQRGPLSRIVPIQNVKKFIFNKVRISEYTFSEYTFSEYTFSGAKSEMAVTF